MSGVEERRASSAGASAAGCAGSTFADRCSRPDISASLSGCYDDVGTWPSEAQLPVAYHPLYNITFFGIEKLHPFDATKFSKVLKTLEAAGVLKASQVTVPKEAPMEVLLDVHTEEYLTALHTTNLKVIQVTELPALLMLPKWVLQSKVVRPLKYHVSGTMLAAAVAIERGWSVNLGGGMHHASSDTGMGWCPFDDITLAVRRLRTASGGRVQRVLLIDLDAHQGNGVERDKIATYDEDLVILDMYNCRAFPRDEEAKAGIDIAVELQPGTSDVEYLARLEDALEKATARLPAPDLIIYNAGTDILAGDKIGRLGVSTAGVVQRDERVWRYALERRAPICQLLSGGYAPNSAEVISASLLNLFRVFELGAKATAAVPPPLEAAVRD